MMNYQVASKSEKGRKKETYERNGDCCGWMEEADCVVLALADGVGSCADDSRASKTTCDLFLEKCRRTLEESGELTEDKLSRFCREIDPVLAVDNDMACFCAVVWHSNANSVTWLHVGDTRIYRYCKAEGLAQITKDDHGKAVNIKINGKLYTDHGAVVSSTPIDNAIGDRNCDFHTGTFEFKPGESIILCSDGMYNSSTFGNDMESLVSEADLTAGIRMITTTDDDDASLLVLRRPVSIGEEIALEELMDGFDAFQEKVPFNALVERFSNEVEAMLLSDFEVEKFARVIAFMKDKKLYPDRKQIDRIFNAAINRLNAMPENESKKKFNFACLDLKDILKFVFTH